MRILIVEDNPTDRELLRFLLESCFPDKPDFLEAGTLQEAVIHLGHEEVALIILDLQLPDSTGRTTFEAIYQLYPSIPIIVMTHNKDRELALDMIKAGAADYLLKDYTNEDDVFRRITFALAKHNQSVRVPKSQRSLFQRLDKARTGMAKARKRRSQVEMRAMTAETTDAMAELSRQMYKELRKLSESNVHRDAQMKHVVQTVDTLDRELLRGHSGRPSMRSQLDLHEHRVGALEGKVGNIEDDTSEAETTMKTQALQLQQTKMSGRTKIILGILTLLGLLVTSAATYLISTSSKTQTKQAP